MLAGGLLALGALSGCATPPAVEPARSPAPLPAWYRAAQQRPDRAVGCVAWTQESERHEAGVVARARAQAALAQALRARVTAQTAVTRLAQARAAETRVQQRTQVRSDAVLYQGRVLFEDVVRLDRGWHYCVVLGVGRVEEVEEIDER